MTIPELYERLSDKDFLDPSTGNLFSRAYMYLYDAKEEYKIRQEITGIKERLIRPDLYRNTLIIDVFEAFGQFLNSSSFGKHNKLEFLQEQENQDSEKVAKSLAREASGPKFLAHLNDLIEKHFKESGDYEVGYVMLHGFGTIYPYLRASKFLSNFEKYYMDNPKYKLILFYPGENGSNGLKLFGKLDDENPYRAIKLINA